MIFFTVFPSERVFYDARLIPSAECNEDSSVASDAEIADIPYVPVHPAAGPDP